MGDRRALQVTGRALSQVAVFAATYVPAVEAVSAADPRVDAALWAALAGAAAAGALVFGWALLDGYRGTVAHPVRLWATSVSVAAVLVVGLLLGLWVFLAAAMGGSGAIGDLVWLLGAGVLAAAIAAGCATAVVAVAVRAGRALGHSY